ncbi:class I SAM-dependent methyltransferase [Microbulbifer sp. JTAC008]|uniref:class I SAM-dependent methyltransferase n=1 Tax=unclassified Microbulbifer TaxID=2619833 RepID=UPI004039231F
MHHQKLFSDKSELYKTARPTYPPELYKCLSSLAPSNKLAWDCACGSGQAAIGLAKLFSSVYASDISVEQIKAAKAHPNIHYQVGPTEQCDLANESCDLVCVAQALHWFDLDDFWPEVLRVLKPKGIFSAWGYNWPVLDGELAQIFNDLILGPIETYWAPQNKLLWNHFKDIDFPFSTIQVSKPTMEAVWDLNEFFNFIHTFSAVRRCIDGMGGEFMEWAYRKAREVWKMPQEKRVVAFDFVLYVGCKKGW